MNDLIDRESAIREIVKRSATDFLDVEAIATVIRIVNQMPTVEERPKGKWIDEGFYADGHGAHAFRYSECGGHIIEYDEDPFCRWCGADMRGEQK